MAYEPHADAIDILILDESGSYSEQDIGKKRRVVELPVTPVEPVPEPVKIPVHEGLAKAGVAAPIDFHNEAEMSKSDQKNAPKRERFRHRQVAYLMAQGLSNKDIAELTGYGRERISTLAHTPFIRELVAHLLQEAGGDPLRELFKGAAVNGFYKLTELMDNPKTPPTVQAAIATGFIDRQYGKPSSTIIHEQKTVVADPKAQADQLLAELEKLDAAKREALERQQKQTPVTQHDSPSIQHGPDFSRVN